MRAARGAPKCVRATLWGWGDLPASPPRRERTEQDAAGQGGRGQGQDGDRNSETHCVCVFGVGGVSPSSSGRRREKNDSEDVVRKKDRFGASAE